MSAPVITIDGPSASGKGTVASRVAQTLGFHYLDSGALYRLVALYAERHAIPLNSEARLAMAAVRLPVEFRDERVFLEGDDVSDAIRSEEIGNGASKIAVLPAVRSALLQRQRDFRRLPGLVTDGRDMGAVVFPDATLKVFLTAGAACRAERRYKQLIAKGDAANLLRIKQDIVDRDARDAARAIAPLMQEPDAKLLDTTELTIDQAVDLVIGWYRERGAQA